jgi:hypothetical protein
MLSNQHLYEELQQLEKICKKCPDEVTQALLKSNIIMIKLLHNMRTNQVVSMRANDIDLVQSKKRVDDEENN